MSDPETATKTSKSGVRDEVAQESSSPQQRMSEHCTTNRPLTTDEPSTGEVSKLGDVQVYITKPSDYPHSPSKLLLFLTNGTGIYSRNNQLQADKYAREGFVVVMPDMFGGDAAPGNTNSAAQDTQEGMPTIIEQVKLGLAETAKSFMLDMWLARHTPEKVMPLLLKVIKHMEEEFADAMANGGGLYAVGYCFGGKYLLLLGGVGGSQLAEAIPTEKPNNDRHESVPQFPIIRAGAMAHGTLVTLEDLRALKAPVTMVCVENDQVFPDDVREEGRSHLKANSIEHEIKLYPGVPHGFAVLGEYEDPKVQESQSRAFGQMISWLKTH